MNHLLFPQPIGLDGYQTILGSCSDVEKLRVSSGNLVRQYTVASIATVGPALFFRITHNARDNFLGVMGRNWRHPWMTNLEIDTSLVTYVDEQGRRYNFIKPGSDWELDQDNSLFLRKNLTEVSGEWHLKGFAHGDDLIFNSSGQLVRIEDAHGQTLTLHYSSGDLISVEESTGRELLFTYDNDLLETVTDPNGNVTTFVYDVDAKLTSVVGPEGCQLSYAYASGSSNGLITSRTDARNNTYSYQYDGSGRLLKVVNPELQELNYAYGTVQENSTSERVKPCETVLV